MYMINVYVKNDWSYRNDTANIPLSGVAESYVYSLVVPPKSSLEWTYLLEGGTGPGSTLKKRP